VPRATGGEAPNLIQLLGPAALVTLALGVVPLSSTTGMEAVQRTLGSAAYLAFGLVTLLLATAVAKVAAAARRQTSGLLYLAAVALAVLAACTAISTASLFAPAAGWGEALPFVATFAPLAGAGAALGLGGYGIARAKDDLLGKRRERMGYAALLMVLALVGIGVAFRMVQRSELFRGLFG
ncbi:MAG: hypothetical protein JRI23_21705, partial [Deltaproteobacteria bacterium]|nr:hypothetical protein [Deltaproteobacteria bacterium]MBW2534559.1 hypothetical protein [Deltaproteobacteria bacterium]